LPIWKSYSLANKIEKEFIENSLGKPNADLKKLFEQIDSLGGVKYAKSKATKYINQAIESLKDLADTEYKELLKGWAKLLISRTS
jgi:geranylgeranyl pyrophosphate synthase